MRPSRHRGIRAWRRCTTDARARDPRPTTPACRALRIGRARRIRRSSAARLSSENATCCATTPRAAGALSASQSSVSSKPELASRLPGLKTLASRWRARARADAPGRRAAAPAAALSETLVAVNAQAEHAERCAQPARPADAIAAPSRRPRCSWSARQQRIVARAFSMKCRCWASSPCTRRPGLMPWHVPASRDLRLFLRHWPCDSLPPRAVPRRQGTGVHHPAQRQPAAAHADIPCGVRARAAAMSTSAVPAGVADRWTSLLLLCRDEAPARADQHEDRRRWHDRPSLPLGARRRRAPWLVAAWTARCRMRACAPPGPLR